MEKLICFDLDGVLVDSKDVHYKALNQALEELSPSLVISPEEHLKKYDGLSTSVKLSLLTEDKGLPVEHHQQIWKRKQEITTEHFLEFAIDTELLELLDAIRSKDIKIAVASNCIRKTVQNAIHALGILPLIDYFVGAEEVLRKKPCPDLYWQCMSQCNALPQDTVIFEDSFVGQQAALAAGARVICVKNRADLTMEKVQQATAFLQNQTKAKPKPIMNSLNILIPMAGRGSRFESAGYTFPKPLIDVMGKPMIQWVIENIGINGQYIFVVQNDHRKKYHLDTLLDLVTGDQSSSVVPVQGVTEGAACTALMARNLIDNDNPLLILNSDQYLEWNLMQSLYELNNSDVDGGIFTFHSTHPKWSYVLREPGSDKIIEVAEKKPISTDATCGVYWWRKGSDFVKYADKMIEADDRTLGEFYICPAFNHAIEDGLLIKSIPVGAMHGLGTPEDLEAFVRKFGND